MSTQKTPDKDRHFLKNIEEIRRRARHNIENGAVTDAYKADLPTVIKILNGLLATELVCMLRYKRHYFMASGIHAGTVSEQFLEHAEEELEHADRIAGRIQQLGGKPNFNPEGLSERSHAQYVEGETLIDMIKEDLIAERIAIESYSEIIRYLGNDDPTTRILLEEILSVEEEHADDMNKLLQRVSKYDAQPVLTE